MAFVPEDGTGLVDANALADVAFADAYFTDRAVAAWTGEDGAKQAALIKATDYVEGRWSARFAGAEQFPDNPQALSYPRTGIGWDGAVPTGIQRAVCEYALRALSKPLAPDPKVDASGFPVQGSRKKVGPIETETTYVAGVTTPNAFVPYPAADMLIKPFLTSSGGRLVRA